MQYLSFIVFYVSLNMANFLSPPSRRVILAHWKDRQGNPFEVFSNLKLFCKSYPEYSYNTLNNYLSKARVPFENESIRIERKELLTRPLSHPVIEPFRMERTVRKVNMQTHDEKAEDLAYWLTRTPQERIQAVTFLISQQLKPGQRMDRTFVKKRKLKEHAIE
jgi:hypothetical protein